MTKWKEEERAVVIDCGSLATKVGFARHGIPRAFRTEEGQVALTLIIRSNNTQNACDTHDRTCWSRTPKHEPLNHEQWHHSQIPSRTHLLSRNDSEWHWSRSIGHRNSRGSKNCQSVCCSSHAHSHFSIECMCFFENFFSVNRLIWFGL